MSESTTPCVPVDTDGSGSNAPKSSTSLTFSSAHHGLISIIPMEPELTAPQSPHHNKVVDLLFEMIKESSIEHLEHLLKVLPVDINTVFHASSHDSLLTAAVFVGSIPVIDLLIQYGANPSGFSQNNETPFSMAVTRGRFDVADLLLDKYRAEFNLFLLDMNGRDLIFNLVLNNQYKAVRYIINQAHARFHRLNLNVRDSKSYTMLYYAHFKNNSSEMVDLLVENNADINQPLAYRQYSFLAELCRRRDPIALDYYKKYCIYVDVNKVQWDGRKVYECFNDKLSHYYRNHQQEVNGDSRLLRALRRQNYNYCYLLLLDGLTTGINIQEEPSKMTAIHYACKLNHINLFLAIMARNPELHHKDKDSRTCLYYAVQSNNFRIAQTLLKAKAPLLAFEKFPNCKSLLEIAAVDNDNIKMTELLLNSGADPNGVGPDNPLAPLSLIIRKHGNRQDYISLFVKYKFAPSNVIRDAIQSGNRELLAILQALGVNIDAPIISITSVLTYQPKSLPFIRSGSDETSRIKAQLSREQTPPVERIRRQAFTQPEALKIKTTKQGFNEQLHIYSSPLTECIRENRLDILEWSLSLGADVRFRDKMGYTPLAMACLYGFFDAVALLISTGSDVNVSTDGGFTPLVIAIIQNNIDIVRLLLDNGADISLPEVYQRIPLVVAANYGRFDILQLLVEHGADINRLTSKGHSALMFAVKAGHSEASHFLISKGADPSVTNYKGNTALFTALSLGYHSIVEDLIAAGESYLDALMVAAHQGHVPVINELMALGKINVNTVDRDYRTALLHAAREGHVDAVRVLIAHGADVNHVDQMKATALSLAVKYRHEDVVKALVQSGVNLNVQDQGSWSPLYHAIIDKHYEIASILIAAGADVNTTDQDGWNSLIAALAYDAPIAPVTELVTAGADVNQRDRNGLTPLMVAATRGNADATELLLKHKADYSMQDRTGATAMKKARASTHASSAAIQRLLKKAGCKE